MTISSTQSRKSYSGNGATTAFSFPYKFLSESDLVVVIRNSTTGVETTKTLTTHYTVSGAGGESGGTVTMIVAPASGETITIYRDPELTQEIDFVENDKMPAETLEGGLDRLTMALQRLSDRADRAAQLPEGFTGSFDATLPSVGLVAGASLVFNDDLDGFDVGPTSTEIQNAQTYATNAAASQTAAATSASAAATSATAAAASAAAASTSATTATTQATGAANSAVDAVTQASLAQTQANNAAASAVAADASADAAAASATTASGHATTAAGHVTTASGHASTASTQAGNASSSASAAATSASNAATSATNAAGSATAAASSASAASTSATNAANSATAAAAVIPSQSGNGGKFLKTDGSATSWATAGGAGGVNFIGLDTSWVASYTDDRDAESTVGQWATFADAAASTPVDLTGGTSSLTFARSTANKLNGNASFLITKAAANEQGEGVSVPFNVPAAYQGKNATISIPFKVISGSLVSGDVKVFVYDVTGSLLITPFNNDVVGSAGTITATFPVPGDGTANRAMRLGIYFASTSTTAVTLAFDDVSVGPVVASFGPAMTEWKEYTATWTATTTAPAMGAITVNRAMWRQVGDSIEINYTLDQSLTGGAGSGTYLLPLPNGYTVDSTKCTVGTDGRNATNLGYGSLNYSGNTQYPFHVFAYNSQHLSLWVTAHSNTAANSLVFASGNWPFQNCDAISFSCTIPVANLAGYAPLTSASTFRLSNYLANGTRLTGSDPTKLGEWRALYRATASNITLSDCTSITTAPSVADGIRIWGNVAYNAAGTASQPTVIRAFIGKNKNFDDQWFLSAGRTGGLAVDYTSNGGSFDQGAVISYDPTSGIVTVNAQMITSTSNTYRRLGHETANTAVSNVADGYFDITVSEAAIPVQVGSVRSEVWVYTANGYGSTNNKIRRYTTTGKNVGGAITYADSATAGASFTINEDGVYSVSYVDQFTIDSRHGVSVNSNQLTTEIGSITAAHRAIAIHAPTASRSFEASVILNLSAGDVVRPHSEGAASGASTAYESFRITQVSK